jgi:hypothetical protein
MIHHNYPAIQARCDQYKPAGLIAFNWILDYGGAEKDIANPGVNIVNSISANVY